MLNAIKKFFEQNLSPEQTEDQEHALKLATAALLIEMMQQDGKTTDNEVQAVKSALQIKFGLTESETETLFVLAREETRQAVDFYQFTRLINDHFSPEKKIKVIEFLWNIAYSDNHLDAHEEHMIRRIAELLYVSHKDMMKTKHKVQESITS
ncbi:MAG: TerB family tellurite resistance protein [Pseudomonadota bacterium]